MNGTQYCCTAENCNHQNIDTATCSRATEYESLLQQISTCQNENDDCLTEADNVEITCDGIKSLFELSMECMCTAYGDMYGRLSSSVYKLILQDYMDGVSDSSSEWNDIFGCDINWSCNLEERGVIGNSAVSQFTLFAVVCTAIITLMMR
eukprot:CAMPEP_0197056848 /NCGR_PEP_ID=MMETSP1384-20130603/90373_1 /TAXON_ID=29189 /ORGANISM="Ammonia sp." /LENGTH=149 /DNA_ID=CAMNT_0042491023 /DNA_START=1 /DNA_END=450 /DNA_ORIENTATION=+